MKRHDWYFFLTVFLFAGLLFLITRSKNAGEQAEIYVQGVLVQTVSLNEDQTFSVTGTNGPVTLEVQKGKIQVLQETSPKHLCSKQGFISKPSETIVCLPNGLVVTITGETPYDTIAR